MLHSRPATRLCRCVLTIAALLVTAAPALSQSPPRIVVDQFGYRPDARKIAVLREPVAGFDAPAPWVPGPLVEIRRSTDQTVALTVTPVAWNGGAVHAQSGDRVWHADFTALDEIGAFYVRDPANGIDSEAFAIGRDVYRDVLVQAVRMYFHQRCGTAKSAPHALPSWVDGVCHLGASQDPDCRSVANPSPATSRDLSGGWHDAGDYNKYVNYADDALHDLLLAYEERPEAWTDDFGIPESGNGVPDLLDEIRWELEWLLRMQNADGSVLHKVSVTDFSAASPPSTDAGFRRYAPATASATISACGALAHAAAVFQTLADPASQTFAGTLEAAALSAWGWLVANPGAVPSAYDNAGFVNAAAEDAPYWQMANRIRAAIHLFELTDDPVHRAFVDAGYPNLHLFQWTFALLYEHGFHDALLRYTEIRGATPAVVGAIRNTYATSLASGSHLGAAQTVADPYRAWLSDGDYVWGSNRVKAQEGLQLVVMNRFGLDVDQARDYIDAAEGYLHYLHGVNPLGSSFLTNMAAFGAERSVDQTYHAWFADGTVWDDAATSVHGPPPGYLTGGVNRYFAPDPAYQGPPLEPPQNQPIQKSYRDWNAGWPEASWQVTECHIPYQAAYVRLLSHFAIGTAPRLSLDAHGLAAGAVGTISVGGAEPASFVAVVWGLARGSFAFTDPVWCGELGLDLVLAPAQHVLCAGYTGPGERVDCSLWFPPFLAGFTVWLQATQSFSCVEPAQSDAVRVHF